MEPSDHVNVVDDQTVEQQVQQVLVEHQHVHVILCPRSRKFLFYNRSLKRLSLVACTFLNVSGYFLCVLKVDDNVHHEVMQHMEEHMSQHVHPHQHELPEGLNLTSGQLPVGTDRLLLPSSIQVSVMLTLLKPLKNTHTMKPINMLPKTKTALII